MLSTSVAGKLDGMEKHSLHSCAKIILRTRYSRHIRPYWCNELENLKREKAIHYKAW